MSEVYLMPLTGDVERAIASPVRGTGGYQSLAKALRGRVTLINGSRCLRLDDAIVSKVYQYAYRYGTGGYQCRLRRLIAEFQRRYPSRSSE